MSKTTKKSQESNASEPLDVPERITLDWLSKRLAEIACRAKDKEDLKTEMLALNSLARLHRIEGDGDLSLIPGKLMVEFVHTQLPDANSAVSPETGLPLLSGTLQDPVWGKRQREELGRGPHAAPQSDG